MKHPQTTTPGRTLVRITLHRPGNPLRRVVLVVALFAILLTATATLPGVRGPFAETRASGTSVAPSFSLTDIYGHNFTLGSYRNTNVVMIEFTALSCSECQIVERSLHSIYGSYNATGQSPVKVLSVFIEPQYGDNIPALQAYNAKNNITWTMAQDTPSLSVELSYGVNGAIPAVFIVDKRGQIVYDATGVQNDATLRTTLSSALAGTASPVSFVTVSVFALAAIAGVTTFFSPCAFPMFPGYMSLFLGLTAPAGAAPGAAGPGYKGAARKAAFAGSMTALGMILVFLIIGIALIVAARAVAGYIPDLQIIVGAVLVGLGLLLLTNLQYWKIVAPLQRLWYRMGGKRPEEVLATPESASGRRLYVKLFSYGMGYAAAAAGCVAPVIFAAILAGLTLGLLGGIVNILIFGLTAAALMIAVTLLLAIAGTRYMNALKAFTPLIKKVSSVVLVVVGVYLIYFYYTSWVI
ncbi:MAG: redoxin domain-containing protein [Thermoplasmata archaeon]|nr:redoxin domain-containing protein [Thermoplasmata archaeon]